MGQGEVKVNIQSLSFEDAIKRLETVVELLEEGETPLEETIELYQEGVLLARHCDYKLTQVEQKIQILVEEEGNMIVRPFEAKEE